LTRIASTAAALAIALAAGTAGAETAVAEAQARLDRLLGEDRVAEAAEGRGNQGLSRLIGRNVSLGAAEIAPVSGGRGRGARDRLGRPGRER